jgi:HKD family nuclease
MRIQLLGQGYEPISKLSVGNNLIKLFANKEFHTFTGISAFASQAGIIGLSKHISAAKQHLHSIAIVTGIDQKGTSKEALEALLELEIDAYIFYQPSSTIFHPKIYLFEGNDKSELIIGSSNLTSSGLFSNIETSLLISINNNIEEDRKVIEQLKEYFSGIYSHNDPNLKPLTQELINDLVKARLVPTEDERRAAPDKVEKSEQTDTGNIITEIFPKRLIAKMPVEFRGTSITRTEPKIEPTIAVEIGKESKRGRIVWTRKKLPSSSVQVSGSGTNPTGGLRLVQDRFISGEKVIDQTIYFRNILFGKYSWKQVKVKPFVEAAKIPFEVSIKDEYIGKFDLEVRHKPSGEAGQHNYTTSISWGELSGIIRKMDLTGSRLDLYAPKNIKGTFHIVIS